ncbi:MAG: hypothetical protein ABIO38_00210 [Luteimonas sp.]
MSSKLLLAVCMTAFVTAMAAPQVEAGPWGKKKKETAETSGEGTTREVVGRDEVEGEIVGKEIPGSPFARLEIGMSMKQVRDAVGKGVQDDAECGSYMTGKAFIPFHFGGDKMRQECAYKGLGRLVFTNQSDFNDRAVLIKVEYDASEDGERDE